MATNVRDDNTIVEEARKFLKAGRPYKALVALDKHRHRSPALTDAYGVSLMRVGHIVNAIELYRDLVLEPDGISLRPDIPTVVKANYATALLLAHNVSGCLWVLDEINDENHRAVTRIRRAINHWKTSLTWWERIRFWLMGRAPRRPVRIDFPPGELSEAHVLRPAA